MGRLVWLYAIYKFFKIIVPWFWKIAVFSFKTVMITFGSWALSIPKIVRTIAMNWSSRANVAGVPSEYSRVLYYGSVVIASVMVIGGWILSAYLTIWLMHIIFK